MLCGAEFQHAQVFLTDQHLAIVLEYATDGELFDRVKEANRFSEGMARFFFQQLIAGPLSRACNLFDIEPPTATPCTRYAAHPEHSLRRAPRAQRVWCYLIIFV